MPRIAALVPLLLLSFALSQQPQNSPSPHTPPSSPQAQPPPESASSNSEANSRIQRSVEDLIAGDPQLSSADIEAAVDDNNITLTGTVENYAQHHRVLVLVEQYSRWRKIVDNLKTK